MFPSLLWKMQPLETTETSFLRLTRSSCTKPLLMHKDLPFREQMKAQLEAAEACRRFLPGGLEAVASAQDNI